MKHISFFLLVKTCEILKESLKWNLKNYISQKKKMGISYEFCQERKIRLQISVFSFIFHCITFFFSQIHMNLIFLELSPWYKSTKDPEKHKDKKALIILSFTLNSYSNFVI